MAVLKDRSSIAKHKDWSLAVKNRDDYICQKCRANNIKLFAHHINSWKQFPQERFDLSNGIAFCENCHKKFHKIYGKISTKEKFLNFMNDILPIKKSKILLTGQICDDKGLFGERFGIWTVMNKFRIGKNYYCTCLCDCGVIGTPSLPSLKNNTSTNCGCVYKKKLKLLTGNKNPAYKHGLAKRGKVIREYKIWADIKTRCLNKNSRVFDHYGGRGIKICDKWINSFEIFLLDMGLAPSAEYSIDRINVNGDYEPSNCKWATKKEQSNNTRSNKYITYNGKTQTYAQWEQELGLNKGVIWQRKNYGWSDEACINKGNK